MLNSGADKVSINSAAIDDINFIYEAAKKFGSSTIVTNIETIKINSKYYISKSNGRDIVNTDPVSWAKKIQDFEIPRFPDDAASAAGRTLKSRSRPFPAHPGMKYFRRGNPRY